MYNEKRRQQGPAASGLRSGPPASVACHRTQLEIPVLLLVNLPVFALGLVETKNVRRHYLLLDRTARAGENRKSDGHRLGFRL